MASRDTGSSSGMTGSSTPSRRMARTARRMRRRRTYPRPSLEGLTPSLMSISEERMWSPTTRRRTSSVWRGSSGSSVDEYSRPASSAARSRTGRTWSVSYMFSTPCRIMARRSRPKPVSMFFCGSSPATSKSVLERTAESWYCMKTRFQISTNRVSSTAGPPSRP